MNYVRTSMLLAGMTALFMGCGYLIGGEGGMLIALVIAIAMNAFAYWNADKMVLRMQGAQEVPENTSNPMLRAFRQDVARLAGNAGLP